jgi:O-antigen/teichoic acid export membrane protein
VELFGKLGVIQSTLMMFAIFAGPNLGLMATKFLAELHLTDPRRAVRIVALTRWSGALIGAALAVILWIASTPIAAKLLHDAPLAPSLRIASLILLVQCYNGAQLGILAGLHAFRATFVVNAVRGVSTLPFVLLGAREGMLPGALLGMLAAALLASISSEFLIVRAVRISGLPRDVTGAWTERGALLNFSIPATAVSLVVVPVTWLGGALVARQAGGFSEMGVFNAANQWRMALLVVPNVIYQPLLPLLCEMVGMGDVRRFRHLISTNLMMALVVTAVPAAGLVAVAPWILRVYSISGSGTSLAFRLLACSTILSAMSAVAGGALIAAGRMWLSFALNFAWSLLFITTLALWGLTAVGLAGAYLISYALLLLLAIAVVAALVGGAGLRGHV